MNAGGREVTMGVPSVECKHRTRVECQERLSDITLLDACIVRADLPARIAPNQCISLLTSPKSQTRLVHN